MSLSEKWINTIFSVATGSKSRRNLMTPVGFIIFFSFITVLILLSILFDKIFKFTAFISSPLDLVLGLVIIIPGLILAGSCIFYFAKSKGTPVPLNPPKKLITYGPYAYSRNPMITGIFLILIGFGVFSSSISLTFIVSPIYFLLNFIEIKKIEEPEIEKRFGDEYIEYKKNVPMFIPGTKSFNRKGR
jgi:protein-S-isoprenylcysteine O-methyltransferase Ste14